MSVSEAAPKEEVRLGTEAKWTRGDMKDDVEVWYRLRRHAG
jgi:hypothetical protein